MKSKKALAAKILKTSLHKIKIAPGALEEVKKAITRSDMRGLIAVKKILEDKSNHHSRAGARFIKAQKRKGRQKGRGSKKGKKFAVDSRKEKWMAKVRAQRSLLSEMREKSLLSDKNYRLLYNKSKGGYFRNKRHIKLYIKEHNLIEKK